MDRSIDAGTVAHSLPVSGALSPYVSALTAAELTRAGPLPLAWCRTNR